MLFKNLFKITFVFTLLSSANFLIAQSFEGQVKYKMSYKDLPAEIADYQSMLPTEATATIKGHMFKMEQPMGMGMKQVSIMDNKAESGVLLMDIMGKKSAIVMSPDKRKELEGTNDATDIKYLNETKQIAGYTCKKAVVKVKDSDFEMIVFYTEDIKGIVHHQTKGVKGFPLEYNVNSGMFTVQLTAEKVTKAKISEDEFSIPPGYESITMEQFEKSIGR